MSLIVEDGTGMPDADSFVSVEEATTFWADRAVIKWIAATPQLQEAALRQGFTYLALAFRWPGQPLMIEQRGAWPRGGAVDYAGNLILADTIPLAVRDANILLGLEALGINILANATTDPALARKDIKIGPISISNQFDVGTQPRGLPRFPAVDALLSRISNARAVGGVRSARIIRG